MKAWQFPANPIQFVFRLGGIGDFIYWTMAIKWAIENHPWIQGKIIVPEVLLPLMKVWFKEYEPRFSVRTQVIKGLPMITPKPGNPNACGFHLLDMGFMYFCNQGVPSGWRRMPEINGDEVDISRYRLPEKYVVLTTGATARNREMRHDAVNEVARWVLDQGMTPVFLGKRVIDVSNNHTCKFSGLIDYKLGMDLREKTSTLEAACIMAHAKAVVGLDNGLLHLAACSMVPIVFAVTIAEVKYREPYRREGARTAMITPPESVECQGCMSKFRYLKDDDDARKCYFDTYDCTKSLTGEVFIEALKRLL